MREAICAFHASEDEIFFHALLINSEMVELLPVAMYANVKSQDSRLVPFDESALDDPEHSKWLTDAFHQVRVDLLKFIVILNTRGTGVEKVAAPERLNKEAREDGPSTVATLFRREGVRSQRERNRLTIGRHAGITPHPPSPRAHPGASVPSSRAVAGPRGDIGGARRVPAKAL
jgi:hypothetical protein